MSRPCALRQKITLMAKDGVKTTVQRCTHPKCDQFGLDVLPEVCQECTKAIEPATTAGEGDWLKCEGRRYLQIIPICCGGDNTKKFCNTLASPSYNQELTPSVCRNCVHRWT